jgi:predicted nucleic acid-binding protein
MRILVDTSALSRALRRRDPGLDEVAHALARLIKDPGILIVGPVRQEILSGIREPERFGRIREKLRIHRDVNPVTEDFERAAEMSNTCGAAGIQGSGIDFLLCAMAARLDAPIFTTDKDFERYAKHLPIRLHTG